jgi:hypothetical protein
MTEKLGKIIDAKDVPNAQRGSKYRKLFQSISVGKAAVFDEEKATNVRMSFNVMKKRGEFADYYAVQVKGVLYVVHKEEEVKKK